MCVLREFFAPIFKESLRVGATESNIISGFKSPGIWPFNRNKFQDIDFMPSKPTDRPFTPADVLSGEDISMGADIELPHNISQQHIDQEEVEEDDDDWSELRPMVTSTPRNSVEDLTGILRDIRPHQQAPPRKTATRGRKRGKTTILTSNESYEEVRAEQQARDTKQLAIEQRKAAAAAKKEAATLKKLTAAAKKAIVKPTSTPARVSKRRMTVASYADVEYSDVE